MGRRRTPELYRAPFPLYALRVEPSTGLLITAGGGGAAKTGIKNGVHFLQLEQIGGTLSASLLHSHDTETRATMNLALAGNILAAGQDASCQLLQFRTQELETSDKEDNAGSQEQGPRQRKGMGTTTETQETEASTQREGVELNVENLQSVQTDFGSDPLQKTVCFNHDNTLLATGGTDGFVRVWQVPSLEKVLEFKAHEGEIEDLTLGPGDKMVTAGWDFKACVWQRDQLVTGLCWDENLPPLPDTPYRYQACRECPCVVITAAVCWAHHFGHPAASECLPRIPLAFLVSWGNKDPGYGKDWSQSTPRTPLIPLRLELKLPREDKECDSGSHPTYGPNAAEPWPLSQVLLIPSKTAISEVPLIAPSKSRAETVP
ncbi:prolactin regulatory element-binding protein isoform X2 [Dromiciops gliroides]|uniref:prolactin regulatory element-binding protein isoform X2 n=1 Tax=Dromiciops gliroides TaxID=33562 RepID=UPI001CC4A1D9|nr:prolactin regulatory element-binding protein isoform X2 [Dromiciops gliroides]